MVSVACNCWMWEIYSYIKEDEFKLCCTLVTACSLLVVIVLYSMHLLSSLVSAGFKFEIGRRVSPKKFMSNDQFELIFNEIKKIICETLKSVEVNKSEK